MSPRLLSIVVPVLISFASIATSANAATINFNASNLLRSTVEGFQEITAPGGVSPATMPADATFTIAPPNGFLNSNVGAWFRFNFNLPAGFTGLSMNIQLSVDNEIQLFVNDQNAAVEDDTVVQNFVPPFPQFTLNSNGTVTDITGTWDALPITQSMFQVGANELTFFATDNGGVGGFTLFDSSISFNQNGTGGGGSASEPGSVFLLGLGLLGLLAFRRRR